LSGKPCPECGNHALIKKDGCEFCTACGHVGACGYLTKPRLQRDAVGGACLYDRGTPIQLKRAGLSGITVFRHAAVTGVDGQYRTILRAWLAQAKAGGSNQQGIQLLATLCIPKGTAGRVGTGSGMMRSVLPVGVVRTMQPPPKRAVHRQPSSSMAEPSGMPGPPCCNTRRWLMSPDAVS
jgi:hypothetical protein